MKYIKYSGEVINKERVLSDLLRKMPKTFAPLTIQKFYQYNNFTYFSITPQQNKINFTRGQFLYFIRKVSVKNLSQIYTLLTTNTNMQNYGLDDHFLRLFYQNRENFQNKESDYISYDFLSKIIDYDTDNQSYLKNFVGKTKNKLLWLNEIIDTFLLINRCSYEHVPLLLEHVNRGKYNKDVKRRVFSQDQYRYIVEKSNPMSFIMYYDLLSQKTNISDYEQTILPQYENKFKKYVKYIDRVVKSDNFSLSEIVNILNKAKKMSKRDNNLTLNDIKEIINKTKIRQNYPPSNYTNNIIDLIKITKHNSDKVEIDSLLRIIGHYWFKMLPIFMEINKA